MSHGSVVICVLMGLCWNGVMCSRVGGVAKSFVVVLHDGNFDTTQNGEWVVDFYAPWCSHCKQLEPVWEDVALEMRSVSSSSSVRVHVAKLDAVLNPVQAKRNAVQAYPTIIFYRDGKAIGRYGSASRDKEHILAWINSMTSGSSRQDDDEKNQSQGEEGQRVVNQGQRNENLGQSRDKSKSKSKSGQKDRVPHARERSWGRWGRGWAFSTLINNGPLAYPVSIFKGVIRENPLLAVSLSCWFGCIVGVFLGVSWALNYVKKLV
ncbi:hypothetical protein AAMO2058_000000200 [Amorphochlora amoebiformis]